MDSRHPLRIGKPAADLDSLSFTDITLLGEWVASLPVANTDQTAYALTRATDEVARLKLSYGERLDALESVRPAVEYICTRLDQAALQSGSRDQKVAQIAQKLHANLSIGYKTVVVEAAAAPEAESSAAVDALTVAIHRAISDLSRILLRTLQQYVPPTAHLWLELNQLYGLAEHLEVTHETSLDTSNQSGESSTIDDAYLRAVLLAASRPNQLRYRQLTQVFNALEQWTSRVKIETNLTDALILIDLEADKGPMYRKIAPAGTEPRAIRTEVLAFEIEAYLKELDSEVPVPDYVSEDVLRHVMAAWGRMRPRQHRRADSKGALKVCVGLRNAHYYLSGAVDFAEQLSSTDALLRREVNPFLEDTAPTADVQESDVWNDALHSRIPENPNIMDPDKILLEAKRPDTQSSKASTYKVFETEIEDISPGGYRVAWHGEPPKNLQTGDLLAVREEADNRWCVAVLRWLRQDIGNLVAGLQLIAPRAIPVAIRVVQKKGGPTDYARAFLLPEIKTIDQPPTLITPTLPFQAGQKVHIQRQGIQSTAQLLADVLSTQSFNQFTFRMLDGYLENSQINLNMTQLSEMTGSETPAARSPDKPQQQ